MTVDVVIVGGGSAGCVLAARLIDDPGRRVLLLVACSGNRLTATPRRQPVSASTRATISRQSAPTCAGSAVNCDGLKQNVWKPRSHCAGMVSIARSMDVGC